MKTNASQPVSNLVPAAQYVRMSGEAQQYSIDNQKAAIQEYADSKGFVIVKTYADAGRSGLVATNRTALRELLRDVVTGNTDYKAILVYDVSRWGRYIDSDEAAHYEFVCSGSGIPLHYCAEQFANDGTTSSSLLKMLKRSMAAEFSRELGEKVFQGKARLVRMGYWVGGPPGYGYRRLMVSADGKPKQLLKYGEHKSLTTDRVILVRGPQEEVKCVRRMFSMVLEGTGCTAIARDLNRRGIPLNARRWTHQDVFDIVTHPKYAGWNVWQQTTERLRGKKRCLEQSHWITKPEAFAGIVDQETFDRAQAILPRQANFLWSDQEIISRFRRLLKAKGRLSESIVLQARSMPNLKTVRSHFGSTRRLYEAIGYDPGKNTIYRTEQSERSMHLRRTLFDRIQKMFPDRIEVAHLPKRSRLILRVDHDYFVSILLCPQKRKKGGPLHWVVEPCSAERECVTLLCKMNLRHDQIVGYYLLPSMDTFRSHCSFRNDPWLRGKKLASLSEFYEATSRVHESRHSRN